jgi:hypothetical protein
MFGSRKIWQPCHKVVAEVAFSSETGVDAIILKILML